MKYYVLMSNMNNKKLDQSRWIQSFNSQGKNLRIKDLVMIKKE